VTQSPIVMQTLWRTRGTYFWSLFRKNPAIRAYNEPLHEGLAARTDRQWALDFTCGGIRSLRHPKVQSHYFTEFPLRPEGGVALFNPAGAFDNFMPTDAEDDPTLAAYLRSLVEHAERHGQQAFFKFVRGGLRARQIRRAIGGTQVYLNRPLGEIEKSFRSFGPASYFTAAVAYLAIRYADRPFCGILLQLLQVLGPFDDASIRSRLSDDPTVARPVSSRLNQTQITLLVATFWLAYLLEGLAIADLVIDTERLGADARHRQSIAAQLPAIENEVAFENYHRSSPPDALLQFAPVLRVILDADERLSALARAVPPPAVDSLGETSRRFLDAVL
jgi:hypothetical protein